MAWHPRTRRFLPEKLKSRHNFCPVTSMVIARMAATAMVVMTIVSKILSIMRGLPAGPQQGEQ